jgi:hypothetical protein
MEGGALLCMQMGWGGVSGQVKWSTQVEESKAACGYAHPFVRVPQFEFRFVCDMAV